MFVHRCRVPDCDHIDSHYDEPWVSAAIPAVTGKTNYVPEFCERYIRNGTIEKSGQCFAEMFSNFTEKCESWVFSGERTIVNDVSVIFSAGVSNS